MYAINGVNTNVPSKLCAHKKTRSAQQKFPSKKFFAHTSCTSSHYTNESW